MSPLVLIVDVTLPLTLIPPPDSDLRPDLRPDLRLDLRLDLRPLTPPPPCLYDGGQTFVHVVC